MIEGKETRRPPRQAVNFAGIQVFPAAIPRPNTLETRRVLGDGSLSDLLVLLQGPWGHLRLDIGDAVARIRVPVLGAARHAPGSRKVGNRAFCGRRLLRGLRRCGPAQTERCRSQENESHHKGPDPILQIKTPPWIPQRPMIRAFVLSLSKPSLIIDGWEAFCMRQDGPAVAVACRCNPQRAIISPADGQRRFQLVVSRLVNPGRV